MKINESSVLNLKKTEKKFLTILIFFTIFLCISGFFFRKDTSNSIKITVSGDFFGNYSLQKDQIIPIGETNICEISNGKAKMISATCPDHLCIKQNPIDINGGTIVCLPNKVVIEGGRSDSSIKDPNQVDAVN